MKAKKRRPAARRRCLWGRTARARSRPEIKIGIMPGHIHRKGRIGVCQPLGR